MILSKPPLLGSRLSNSFDDRVINLDGDHGINVLVANNWIPSVPPGRLGSLLSSMVENPFSTDDDMESTIQF